MKVIFSVAVSRFVVIAVTWKDDDGDIVERTLLSDGSVKDRVLNDPTLYSAMGSRHGSSSYAVPVEVADVRSAFKYLGKSSDLVELLPEATITPEE